VQTLRVPAAAEYCQIAKSTLDKLRVYGGGPIFIRVGKRIIYDRADLDTWLLDRKVANTAGAKVQAA
jgi:predicted DNA-binding transcriptional regulator AlpA